MSRVLCYSPYNRWALHGQWEMTILHALQRRGADVHYVLCDGLYTDCDVFWAATDPRPPRACVQCQSEVIGLVAGMGMDFEWLGRYLMPAERREARRWEQSLSRDELVGATYGDWEVSRWIVGSVHSHLRATHLDLSDPDVERTFRSYLFSGLVACFALERLLDESRPDVLFLFNGRQSSTRVAFELARRRGIRVVCHERGMRFEAIYLTVDRRITTLESIHRFWDEWGDVPLTRSELETVERLLVDREHGSDVPLQPFSRPPQPLAELRATVGLDPDRPTWVLFTSSDDELVSDEEWQGYFPTQLDWIERTVDYARRHPELQLVIRVHPNTGGQRSIGVNATQLEEMEELRRRCPENVRVVAPDDKVSSYTLMELADVGFVYHSTVGLEMACKGKAVVVAANAPVAGTPFVHTADDPAAYEALLDEMRAVPLGAVSDDVRRLAYRFAYGQFFRLTISFPLVAMPNGSQGVLRWSSTQELDPGRDASLDRCARILLDGEPVCPPPAADELARSDEEERAYFEAARRFNVLAFADELIDDLALLEAWGSAFSASDPATLVIRTPQEVTELLVDAVSRAGLDREGTPDLIAVDAELDTLGQQVDAVFSRRDPGDLLAGTPRFDDTSTGSLRSLAGLGR